MTPYPVDANSFWRCMGPMSYMAKHFEEFSITLSEMNKGGTISWVEVGQYDMIFMHRPCRPDDLIIMQIAYNMNIPVWVDYDDWLFEIPSWNPNAQLYNNMAMQSNMAQALACADIVSVSTTELYNQYRAVNPNTVIIPNAYRSDLFKFRKENLEERNDFALWRGSNTHDGDLLSINEAFRNIKHKVKFIGSASWLLLSQMNKDNYEMLGSFDAIEYFKGIYDHKPKVMIFPLVDCLFNRCKSNIAWMEALHSGALCLSPDMPEWNYPGNINYKPHDSNSFTESLDKLMNSHPDDHKQQVTLAFNNMKQSYDIEVINKHRMECVYDLLNRTLVKKNPRDQAIGLMALSVLKENFKKYNEAGTKTTS